MPKQRVIAELTRKAGAARFTGRAQGLRLALVRSKTRRAPLCSPQCAVSGGP